MAITGTIVNPGDYVEVSYSGGIQQYEIPFDGLYQLEVWGASGGGSYGGKGGYSKGYVVLNKNTNLFIVVGGNGDYVYQRSGAVAGGYNGGGRGQCGSSERNNGSGGGGATHIAKITGTLASIGATSFVDNGNGYIVAGGGGGGASFDSPYPYGGNGGGLTGSNGTTVVPYADGGQGGTQSAGGAPGLSATGGTFGAGGYPNHIYSCGGGGGGLYGGGASGQGTGGGGGSAYIGGVPSITYKGTTYAPETTNGINTGNGKATITYVAKAFPTVFLGDNAISAAYLGDTDISNILIGDNPLAQEVKYGC